MLGLDVFQLISAVVMKDWSDVLETCDLQNWKEALAAVMTYAKPDEFSSLCGESWLYLMFHTTVHITVRQH